ncbi:MULTISPECIES: hypothetical protein [unclassified Sulfitobacter]|uniref:hypothetical protein n=1 Tax=unclassified Sulfitobacter TaxID=196795 RepID=UPI00374671DE
MPDDVASMFVPINMTDAVLVASNIPENDAPTWASGSYNTGDQVVYLHNVYEAVTAGASTVPPNQDPVMWVRIGATNRWRPFDGSIGQDASRSGTITYDLVASTVCDGLAFIGLKAVSLRVRVVTSGGAVHIDETHDLVDGSSISSWLDFFTYETVYEPELVFTGLPVFPTDTVEITLDGGGGTASIGEIVLGRQVMLGKVIGGSRSGFTDYTSRNVDDFGNIELITRPTARKAEWRFVFDTRSNRRIQRELEKARGTKCFFHPGDDMTDFYLSVFGVANEFFPSLDAGGNTIDVLSLTGVS